MSLVTEGQSDRRREILGFLMLAFTTLLFLALVTDSYQGESRRPISSIAEAPNALGMAGAVVAGLLGVLVGPSAHVLYFITCVWGIMLVRHRPLDRFPMRLLGTFLLTGSVAGLLHIDLASRTDNTAPGGAFGAFMGDHLLPLFGIVGANIIAATLAVIGILLATEFLFLHIFVLLRGLSRMVLQANMASCKAAGALWAAHQERVLERRQPFRKAAQRILGSEPGVDEPSSNVPEDGPAYSGYLDDSGLAGEAMEDLSRIHVRTGATYVESAQDNPLGEAPSQQDLPLETPTQSVETEPLAAAEEGVAFFEALAEEQAGELEGYTPFNVLANAAEIDEDINAPTADEESMESEPVTDGKPLESVSLEALLTARNPTAPNKPLLRRKTAVEDKLPADYEYPKQYTKPSLNLLDSPHKRPATDMSEQLRQTSVRLEDTLKTFDIEARVTRVVRGPTITRFELQPAPGIKVSRFHSLADDIALALKAQGVRVEAPIPGKGRVGIEVPNKTREPVLVRELLESEVFQKNNDRLKLALGKDIAGEVLNADLATMPHLLVAGATGAGKTVCIKTFLASLLFTNTPDEMQLILVDPKMVELSIFNGIPHLTTPVVVDPKKAATALNWLINEMEERYRLFAHLRMRNIEVYNERVANGEIEMVGPSRSGSESITVNRKLPYIVCIIDELADLMMSARAEVEDAIARLTQLARATGIHLIIATQRPSVDVLTGVIKANFPVRMSFQVSSRVDSRCILDEIGAERLIGKGDLLYLPAGRSKPLRIQGAFVSDREMEALIEYLKTQAPPQYRDDIERFGQSDQPQDDLLEEGDELFEDAVRVVLDTGQASISMVQRRLRVGYTRAARLIDMMELKGIVGPHTGSKAREILVDVPRNTDEVA